MEFSDFQKDNGWTVYDPQYDPKESEGHKVKIEGTAESVIVRCLNDEPGHPYGIGKYQAPPNEQITGPNYTIKLNGKGPQGKPAIKCEPAPANTPSEQTPSWSAEDRS